MSFPDTPTPTPYSPEQQAGGPTPTWSGIAATASQPPPRRPRRALLAALAAAGVLGLMAVTGLGVWLVLRPDAPTPAPGGPPGSGSLEVTGVVTLQRGQFVWQSVTDTSCEGLNSFADIRAGTQVTVTDAAGKVLAVGSVSVGTAQGITTEVDGMHRAGSCVLPFKVSGIPRGVGPYGVEVSHRGVLRYNEGDLGGLMLGFN